MNKLNYLKFLKIRRKELITQITIMFAWIAIDEKWFLFMCKALTDLYFYSFDSQRIINKLSQNFRSISLFFDFKFFFKIFEKNIYQLKTIFRHDKLFHILTVFFFEIILNNWKKRVRLLLQIVVFFRNRLFHCSRSI